jgi:hypothetical protein
VVLARHYDLSSSLRWRLGILPAADREEGHAENDPHHPDGDVYAIVATRHGLDAPAEAGKHAQQRGELEEKGRAGAGL